MSESLVKAAMAAAKMRALRTHLLALHKALLNAERARYEAAHGPIGTAHQVLRLVMSDPWFAWLRPIANLIIAIDERLAEDRPVDTTDADRFDARARQLLFSDGAPEDIGFRENYRRVLQASPDAVMSHGTIVALLDRDRT